MKKIVATIVSLILLPSLVLADDAASALNFANRASLQSQHRYANRPFKKAQSKSNFSGGWHGRFVAVATSCPSSPASFPFRHIVSLSGNSVTINTSHDGVMRGSSRDKGQRLEVSAQYRTYSGMRVTSAVVYKNLRGNVADIGYAAIITDPSGKQCRAIFGGQAIRAF